VVVQHVARSSQLPKILGWRTALRVKWAEEGDRLRPGAVFLAPPDRHLVVNPGGTLSLSHAPRVHHVRPSAEPLFSSAAAAYGPRAVAVVLTGGDANGSAAVRDVKRAGGTVIAQDEATSEHFDMPRAAIATGAVDHVVPLGRIAPLLEELVARLRGPGPRHDAPGLTPEGDPDGEPACTAPVGG
jgi:two-component system chemotaxis response regulator CheB